MSLKLRQFAKVSAVAAVAATAAVVSVPSQASAFTLNGWDYAVAGKNNGTGGQIFDYRGIAVKDNGSSITVAINGFMDLDGQMWGSGSNRERINHGDLFFNFTGKSFKEASDTNSLIGINFAQRGSQSGARSTGVYANVSAKNTTRQNHGWHNLNSWKNAVNGNNSYGDLTSDSSYFNGMHTGNKKILNAIDTGDRVADIMMLSDPQLSSAGLDFKHFGVDGTKTLGFTFQKTADFKIGNYVANLFMECGNDGLAIAGGMGPNGDRRVPEPAAMAGMAVVGGLGWMRRRRQRQA